MHPSAARLVGMAGRSTKVQQQAMRPVITFLTQSPSSSRRTQSLLKDMFGMEPSKQIINKPEEEEATSLDAMFSLQIPGLSTPRWDSVASTCPSSGTVLHFLSPTTNSTADVEKTALSPSENNGLDLLSISYSCAEVGSLEEETLTTSNAILEARQFIASHMGIGKSSSSNFGAGVKLAMKIALGRPVTTSQISGLPDGLPLLKLPSGDIQNNFEMSNHTPSAKSTPFWLREIVLPHVDDDLDMNGDSLLSSFANSGLSRPIVGLYQWSGAFSSEEKHNDLRKSLVCRPLPAAKEDRNLAPVSLVFECKDLKEALKMVNSVDGTVSGKVGFSGNGKTGQIRVGHVDLKGVDIRMCESSKLSSHFAESEEALLAGSLADLQNDNVMAEGGVDSSDNISNRYANNNKQRPSSDTMNGLGDCWMEFRANLKSPSGFFSKKKVIVTTHRASSQGSERIARAPNIPYE